MTDAPAELPADLPTSHEMIRELAATVRQQGQLIDRLQHQMERLLRQRFGKSSEKIDPGQLLLFANDILAAMGPEAAPKVEPPAAPKAESKPPGEGHGRRVLPPSLPRKEVLHDLPAERLPCPDCGEARRRIGEEAREQLEYVPASLLVLRHVRPKYACPACEGNVAVAERLPEPIEKGLPGPGLLAQVAVSKYAEHMPLYRQEGFFRRHGVELPRSTTCDWMAATAELLEPIHKAMHRRVLLSRVIGTDDTPVKRQDPRSGAITEARLWAYLGEADHRFVVYDYTPGRSAEGPTRMLKDYRSGYLQSDAYSVYDQIHARGIVEVGCMAHARRKFHEARNADPTRSHVALAWIRRLYEVEDAAKAEITATARRLEESSGGAIEPATRRELAEGIFHRSRQERAIAILDGFEAWLKATVDEVLPKSPMGEAIGYARNHRAALRRYAEAGYLAIDNNAVEQSLRSIALGRKNWLHVGGDRGGRTAAILISIVQSCKLHRVEPWAYIRDVLDRVSTHPAKRIDELLPDAWKPG